MQSALTGHLVFSTLHTNDAPSAVTRLVDMGINSPAAFEGVEADDLAGAGFTAEEAQTIFGRVTAKQSPAP